MGNQQDDHTSDANIKLNNEFYGEEIQPTRLIKNASSNTAENANMQMDRIFNEEEHEFDLQNSTTIVRSNG